MENTYVAFALRYLLCLDDINDNHCGDFGNSSTVNPDRSVESKNGGDQRDLLDLP
jgi:hypothetical protein